MPECPRRLPRESWFTESLVEPIAEDGQPDPNDLGFEGGGVDQEFLCGVSGDGGLEDVAGLAVPLAGDQCASGRQDALRLGVPGGGGIRLNADGVRASLGGAGEDVARPGSQDARFLPLLSGLPGISTLQAPSFSREMR